MLEFCSHDHDICIVGSCLFLKEENVKVEKSEKVKIGKVVHKKVNKSVKVIALTKS
jgi:hypothetical protein